MKPMQSIRRDYAAQINHDIEESGRKEIIPKRNECQSGVVRLVNTTLVELAEFKGVRDYSKVSTD